MDPPHARALARASPGVRVSGHPIPAESLAASDVTVLMSVHNGERYLRAAIASILAQTHRRFELLIIDDASTDGSRAIIASFGDPRIRVLHNETNLGLTKSLNLGLVSARTEFVARQDADDLSRPERLERQVAFMQAHPKTALLGTHVNVIDADGHPRGGPPDVRALTPLGVRWHLLFGNPFAHSSVMFRRSVAWDELGGYDPEFIYNQDFELWSRVVERHSACNLPDILIDYRAHADSIAGRRGDEFLLSRQRNLVRNLGVQRRNVMSILQSTELAEEWPALWTAINVTWVTGVPDQPARAVALVDRLWARFVALYPDARSNPDVRRQTASVLVVIARFLLRRDFPAAVKAFRRAWGWNGRVAIRSLPFVITGVLDGASRSALRGHLRRLKFLWWQS